MRFRDIRHSVVKGTIMDDGNAKYIEIATPSRVSALNPDGITFKDQFSKEERAYIKGIAKRPLHNRASARKEQKNARNR